MTDDIKKHEPLKPGEGSAGCLGLMAGVVSLALLSFVTTAIGYVVAQWLR
ncbi:MAG: hypothetical protein IPJ41_03195 [Phycisphaerales bacterium]|nr:hypothetical protein [Phycisphaerales bacterium]